MSMLVTCSLDEEIMQENGVHLYVLKHLCQHVTKWAHTAPTTGHPGISQTLEVIQ